MDSKENSQYTQWIAQTGLLLAMTLAIQFLGLPQLVTGPLINLMLVVAVFLVGWLGASLIGGLTPWIAMLRGILPAPLAPMIPFIMAGNVLLVISFWFIKETNQYLAVAISSLLKFSLLASGIRFIVEVPPPIAKAMQLPQLLTALVGGGLALLIVKFMHRTDII